MNCRIGRFGWRHSARLDDRHHPAQRLALDCAAQPVHVLQRGGLPILKLDPQTDVYGAWDDEVPGCEVNRRRAGHDGPCGGRPLTAQLERVRFVPDKDAFWVMTRPTASVAEAPGSAGS